MNGNILSRNNSNVLRGLGILAIMFHNFLHINGIGFSPENEMSFKMEKTLFFFSKIYSGEANILADTVSFIGWTGVSVFVFLTGYGLMTKYSTIDSILLFIKRNYLKLLFLLLPGFLIFLVVDIITGEYSHIPKRLCYLSMLQNLDYPDLSVGPGVYWYFSLTFQLYLFYAFTYKWMNTKTMIALSVLTLFILWFFGTMEWGHSFSIFRHCFTGWYPVFALGVFFSQKHYILNVNQTSLIIDILLSVVLLVIILFMNYIFLIWLFIPIVALCWYFVMAKLLL